MIQNVAATSILSSFVDSKTERFLLGAIITTLTIYTIYNYHVNIKLNKLRIKQEEQELSKGL